MMREKLKWEDPMRVRVPTSQGIPFKRFLQRRKSRWSRI
jgi:hypothetical protein